MLRIHLTPPPLKLARRAEPPPEQPPCARQPQTGGQDSRVGENNFVASMVKFAVGKLADGLEALAPAPALSAGELERLVRENAPVLLFHPDEQYFPTDPSAYIANSELRHHRAIVKDETLAGRGEVDPARLSTLDDGQYNFLDLDNSCRAALGPTPDASGRSAAPINYEVDYGPPFKVTYHVFYAYNDGPLSQNHEGDWERITIEFRQTKGAGGAVGYEPDTVNLSAHEGGNSVSWREAAKDENGRLLVYVAKGSHANYAAPDRYPTFYDADLQYTPRQIFPSPEDLAGQTIENLTDDETALSTGGDPVALDLSQSPLLDVRQQPWYPQEGGGVQWGERGSAFTVYKRDIFSGPAGPSEEKGAVG